YAQPSTLRTLKKSATAEESKPEPVEGVDSDEQPAEPDTKGKPVNITRPSELLEAVLAAGRKGLSIQRYKGLGEMNAEPLWAAPRSRTSSSTPTACTSRYTSACATSVCSTRPAGTPTSCSSSTPATSAGTAMRSW